VKCVNSYPKCVKSISPIIWEIKIKLKYHRVQKLTSYNGKLLKKLKIGTESKGVALNSI